MSERLLINVGCGMAPTPGWVNVDNSWSVKLAQRPFLFTCCRAIGLINSDQVDYVQFCRQHEIVWADVTGHLPFSDKTVDAIYSCHMLEHLDRRQAAKFLGEVHRVLSPGGVVRITVPDLEPLMRNYLETGDADTFVDATLMAGEGANQNWKHRIKYALAGPRHHLWMYDAASLSKLISEHGFVDVMQVSPGTTRISDCGALDLYERAGGSVTIEAVRP